MISQVRALYVLLIVFSLAACNRDQVTNSRGETQELTVFAAASLTEAFNELAEAYEAQQSNMQITLNFAGSSQLTAQLKEGGVADIFASANPTQMQAVIEAGLVKADTERLFVSNQLTIVLPDDNPANITTLEGLAKPDVQLILAVVGVPIRDYTDSIVKDMPSDIQEQFYANLVSEEGNVRQILAKIALGEADAGIVYTSDITPDFAGRVQQINIPDAQNVRAVYPIAPLIDGSNPELAQGFIDFIFSEEGQHILSRWGFLSPPGQ